MRKLRYGATVIGFAAVLSGFVVLGMSDERSTTQLRPKEPPKSAKNKKPIQVAILIFDGVEILDFAGPAEVFVVSGNGRAFRVFTVGATTDPIRTMGNLKVIPEFGIKNAPQPDVLVVPGGSTSNIDRNTRQWLRKTGKEADIVMSVCMGAFVLADLGLLDGIEATTHSWGIEGLKRAAPKCKVVTNHRFVDSGKVITTAGVTAGIDGALHVVERYHGKAAARWTAQEWMEYTPKARDASATKK